MGTLLVYSIQAGVMLIALFAVYKIAFRNSTQHGQARALLLSMVTMSLLCAPIVSGLQLAKSALPSSAQAPVNIGQLASAIVVEDVTEQSAVGVDIASVVVAVYAFGVAVMLLSTLYSIARLAMLIVKGRRSSRDSKVIVADNKFGSFSWFGYIVMTTADYRNNYEMIACHERQHIRLRHSFDLLYMQLYKALNWYNPVAYLVTRELQVVHEYQADRAVISNGFDAKTYQLLLLNKLVGTAVPAVVNGINNSQLKLRIIMMLKKKQSAGNRVAAALLAPVAIVAAVVALSQPTIANSLREVAAKDSLSITVDKSKNVYVDGNKVNQADLDKINPSDIQSINIVTDKSAKAENKDSVSEAGNGFEVRVHGYRDDNEAGDGQPTYFVDGVATPFEQVWAMSPSTIKAMKVERHESTPPTIYITTKSADDQPEQSEKPQTKAAQLPTFPGGEGEMMKWLGANIQYPAGAPTDGKKRTVLVGFTITKTGEIANAKVARSSEVASLDAEALRVIQSMPVWQPGRNENGEAVAVEFALPINFKTMIDD